MENAKERIKEPIWSSTYKIPTLNHQKDSEQNQSENKNN